MIKPYIALLRGINVGGKNTLPMQALKHLFLQEGFQGVQTYLQSGNVIFCSQQEIPAIAAYEKQLTLKIWQAYQLQVPVIIKSLQELMKVYQENPYTNDPHVNKNQLYFTFLAQKPVFDKLERLAQKSFFLDEWFVQDQVVYLLCKTGYGKTKLNNNYWESALQVTATTRNWNTVEQLIKLGRAQQ